MKKGIIGVAGEYFVAAELSQLGIVATLTLKNTPSIDILATNLENGKYANIQVKTMSVDNKTGWRLSVKDEMVSNIKNHFYVMVNLQGNGQLPEYFVIPQAKLAKLIYEDNKNWLAGSPKRKETTMRLFNPFRNEIQKKFGEKYKNNWKILGLL
ncbi:MAG TPA: aspartate ammonia-lyase [Candidatus Magasanikbacteria bacterium]|nr:aspartate ammonia-lyase [Candidatus Magasanikbacteria bacterium]